MTRPRLRLLHTSDVHIGDDLGSKNRLNGLRAVVDAALEQSVDGLLIVGDFFDSSRVRQPEAEAALAELARLSMPTIVTPGNHDCLEPPSIYERVSVTDAGGHVHFAAHLEGGHLVFDELGLSVWARALWEHSPSHRPLEGYAPHRQDHWNVVLAHGHYVPAQEASHRSSLISDAEIAGLQCDYLALGHWHRFCDVSINGVAAFYCGSPSEVGGSFASANLVTLDEERSVQVERVPLWLDEESGSWPSV